MDLTLTFKKLKNFHDCNLQSTSHTLLQKQAGLGWRLAISCFQIYLSIYDNTVRALIKGKEEKRCHLFILYFRKSNLFQTFLQLQTVLGVAEHISSHHHTVHELCKIFSYLNKRQVIPPIRYIGLDKRKRINYSSLPQLHGSILLDHLTNLVKKFALFPPPE